METNDNQPQEEARPIFEHTDDYVEFYFNNAQVGYTGFDIYAFLSETAHGYDGQLRVRHKARVSMAPKEAKLFALFLANAVKRYEEAFGEVSVKEVMETVDTGE